jgi:hypothetical protein
MWAPAAADGAPPGPGMRTDRAGVTSRSGRPAAGATRGSRVMAHARCVTRPVMSLTIVLQSTYKSPGRASPRAAPGAGR